MSNSVNAKEFYFVPAGTRTLPTSMFWNTTTNLPLPGISNDDQFKAFDEHSAHFNPNYRMYGPYFSKGYALDGEGLIVDKDWRWMDVDKLGTNEDPGIINSSTDWTCTPTDNQAIQDNPVPNCGHWTHGSGENRRNGDTKNYKHQMLTGNGDLNMVYDMGYGGVLNAGNGRSRESHIVGIDGWIRAESQKQTYCIAGLCHVWAMFISTLTVDDITSLIQFIQCIIDDDCQPNLATLPGNGKSNPLMDSLVGMLWNVDVTLSDESNEAYRTKGYTQEMVQELKAKLKENDVKLRDYYRPIRERAPDLPDLHRPVLENVLLILQAMLDNLLATDKPLDIVNNLDLLLECKFDTPYNTIPTFVKGTSEQQLGGTECWGKNKDDNWHWHRISKTVDVEKHLALNILGCTWNGWLWHWSHSSGGSRIRLIDYCNIYPIRTLSAGLAVDDRKQDRFKVAVHYWDKDNLDSSFDSRWSRDLIRVMNESGGTA